MPKNPEPNFAPETKQEEEPTVRFICKCVYPRLNYQVYITNLSQATVVFVCMHAKRRHMLGCDGFKRPGSFDTPMASNAPPAHACTQIIFCLYKIRAKCVINLVFSGIAGDYERQYR